MANVIIVSQPVAASVIPGQDVTFSVTPSADFSPVSYAYQWLNYGVDISGATSSTYFIDPVIGNHGSVLSVSVSALSGSPLVAVATVISVSAVLTVVAESSPFDKFALYPETGKERFARLRNLGYV